MPLFEIVYKARQPMQGIHKHELVCRKVIVSSKSIPQALLTIQEFDTEYVRLERSLVVHPDEVVLICQWKTEEH